jgi:hypothetical protein
MYSAEQINADPKILENIKHPKRPYEQRLADSESKFDDQGFAQRVLDNPHSNPDSIQKFNDLIAQYNQEIASIGQNQITEEMRKRLLDINRQAVELIHSDEI